MALFKRKEVEPLASLIECTMPAGMLVKKSEIEDFYTGSQLIVHESQQALFFLNGQPLDLFSKPGKYTLETQTLPKLTAFLNIPLKGKNQFRSEIYFINCTELVSVRWGTDSRFIYFSKADNVPIELGARGEMKMLVTDPRRLISKLVGTNTSLETQSVISYFESLVKSHVTSLLPAILSELNVGAFEIDSQIAVCSGRIQEELNKDLSEYGLKLPMFRIVEINKDNGLKKIIDVTIGTRTKVIEEQAKQDLNARGVIVDANAKATKRAIEGFTKQEEMAYEVAGKMAENDSMGGMAMMGTGLGAMGGMAVGAGSVMAGMAAGVLSPITNRQNNGNPPAGGAGVVPPPLGLKNAPVSQSSPSSAVPASSDPMEELRKKIRQLQLLRDEGMLSESEFEAERKKLVDSICN